MANIVYIGASLDGYISGPDGDLGWLEYVPVPEGDDLGFSDFMDRIDAVVMGRKTFETLIGFGVGWHYPKPGIILSSTMTSAPKAFADHVQFASGTPGEIVKLAKSRGFENLYIDGGVTIQRFLRDDLIDEAGHAQQMVRDRPRVGRAGVRCGRGLRARGVGIEG